MKSTNESTNGPIACGSSSQPAALSLVDCRGVNTQHAALCSVLSSCTVLGRLSVVSGRCAVMRDACLNMAPA